MVLTPPGTGREFVGDDPPYSRLFVVYNRKDPVTEQDIRDDFGQFGEVQDIFIVKERSTMEPKGDFRSYQSYYCSIRMFMYSGFVQVLLTLNSRRCPKLPSLWRI